MNLKQLLERPEQTSTRPADAAPPRLLRKDFVSSQRDVFLAIGKDVPGEHWTLDQFLRDLPGKWDLSLVARGADGAPIAYAVASRPSDDTVHLHRLMVDSDARHRGLGARLIRELSHRAARSGARWLRLKVLPENVGAIRFYRREGFERVATDNNHDVMRIESRRVERRVAIHQPNYLPWCGFFSKCAKADVLVVLDDVQMPTGRSYVYRTRVASQAGSQWLSIPTKRGATDPIVDVQFADLMWSKKHLSTLRMQYGKRPRFKEVFEWLEALYAAPGTHLSCFNETLNRAVCDYLGLEVPSVRSSELNVTGASDDRLIALVQEVGGSVYVSGKGGQNYQAPEKFDGAGIRLDVQTYEPTPYNQGREAFEPGLSIVDALFNLGRETVSVLR